MSLDWDITRIKDYETTCFVAKPVEGGEREMRSVTKALIYTTMGVDLGRITEKNYREFHWRYRVLCAVDNRPPSITVDDVKAHVGLSVNVIDTTTHQFMSKLAKSAKRWGF